MTNQWTYHHDAREYAVAKSESAKFARAAFEAKIEAGRDNAKAVIDRIVATVPNDAIVSGTKLKFDLDKTDLRVWYGDGSDPLAVHPHAFGQVVTRGRIPIKWADELRSSDQQWQHDLLLHNLKETYQRTGMRSLSRVVDGRVLGWLSDRYKRIDSSIVLNAVLGIFQELGIVPLGGTAADVRWSLKGILPIVFEPINDEVIMFGIEVRHSDFGKGPLQISFFVIRLRCTNLMTGEDGLRMIHLGKKLSDDIRYSEETYRLDSMTTASAAADVVRALLSPDRVNKYCDTIKDANGLDMSWAQAKAAVAKLVGETKLTKDETERVHDAFVSADVYNLPPGQNLWRLSNAVSWLAVNTDDKDRQLDLERAAGLLIAA